MNRLAIAVTAALLLAGTAHAEETRTDAISDPVSAGNFYASVFGGAALLNNFDFVSTLGGGTGTVGFDPGLGLDASLGYDFGNGLSVEAQIGHLGAALASGNYNGTDLLAEGTASTT